QLAAEVDRALVERRGHGDASELANALHQRGEIVIGQARVDGLLDVADIGAIAKIFVDEGVHVAELKLQGGSHVVESHHLRERVDDFEPAFGAAPVIVGYKSSTRSRRWCDST